MVYSSRYHNSILVHWRPTVYTLKCPILSRKSVVYISGSWLNGVYDSAVLCCFDGVLEAIAPPQPQSNEMLHLYLHLLPRFLLCHISISLFHRYFLILFHSHWYWIYWKHSEWGRKYFGYRGPHIPRLHLRHVYRHLQQLSKYPSPR